MGLFQDQFLGFPGKYYLAIKLNTDLIDTELATKTTIFILEDVTKYPFKLP